MITHRLLAGVVVAGFIASAATLPGFGQQDDNDVAGRVRVLSAELKLDSVDDARERERLQRATALVREEIDRFIQTAISPTANSTTVQARLRGVLSAHVPNPDLADPPFARAVDLVSGRALVVAYTIVRPPHFDSATIRGYRRDIDRYEFADATGADFGDDLDGFSLQLRELPSPQRAEAWCLAWGKSHTFNGSKVRVRVYAFDGEHFRTVWSPEDVYDAEVQVTARGFSIEHLVVDATPRYTVHDDYSLTVDGPVRSGSRIVG